MPEFTVYVTGGGDYFYTTLNGVAMIFNDGKLIWSVILLGGMFALISGSWYVIQKNIGSGLLRTNTFLEHAIVMVVVSFIAFVPTRLTIQDIYGSQNSTPIDNVPLLISLPAAMFSGIGYDAFKAIDTAFQSVQGSTMTVSETGFVTPLKLMLAVRGGIEKVAPETYKSWVNYIGACTYSSAVTTGGTLHSKDVAQYLLDNGNDGGMVRIFVAQSGAGVVAVQQGYYATCTEAKSMLSLAMDSLFMSGGSSNPMSSAMRNVNMNMTEPNKNSVSGQWDWTSVENAYNSFQAGVGGASQNAQEFMKNSLIRNAVVNGFECGGNMLTAADQLLCIQAMNDATQQYSIDAAGRGSWFSKMMLPSMGILQLLFFAFSVVAFLYGILRGAGAIAFIGKYFLFGAWVFSWLPFIAIINAFINWMVIDKMRSNSVRALTIENYDSYFSSIQNNLALASELLAATPLITLGFLTGSMYALSGFAQRLSSNDHMNEKNMAPSTVETGPVMRYGPEFDGNARTGVRTSATTYESINVNDALTQGRESAFSRAQASQFQTMDSFNEMVRARQEEGGSTRISNSDGTSVGVSDTQMYQQGLSVLRGLENSSNYGKSDIASAKAAVSAAAKLMGTGVSAEAAFQSALNSVDNESVKDLVNRSFAGMSQYAENSGRTLASSILSDTTSSNAKSKEVASGFTETASKSETLTKAYKEVDSLSNGIATNLTTSVDQLGSKLLQDIDKGTQGHGWASEIEQRAKILASDPVHGQAFTSYVENKENAWRDSGAAHGALGHMAMLQGLRQFGDYEGYGSLVAKMEATRDVSGVDPNQYADVGAKAANVDPQRGMSRHNARVEAAMPAMGAGHAMLRDEPDMKADLVGGGGITTENKQAVNAQLKDTVSTTAAGVLNPNLSSQEAMNRQVAYETAKSNLYHPPEDATEYYGQVMKTEVAERTTGMSLPKPLPPQEVIEDKLEAARKEASHPSLISGNSPQEREANTRQRVAEAEQKVIDEIAAIQADNANWANASQLPHHVPGARSTSTVRVDHQIAGQPNSDIGYTQQSQDPVTAPATPVDSDPLKAQQAQQATPTQATAAVGQHTADPVINQSVPAPVTAPAVSVDTDPLKAQQAQQATPAQATAAVGQHTADPVIKQPVPAPVTALAVPVDSDPLKTQQAQQATPAQATAAVGQHTADPVIKQPVPAPVTAPAVPVDTDPLKAQQAQQETPAQATAAVGQHTADPVIKQPVPAPVTAPAVPVDTDPLTAQQAQQATPGQATAAVGQRTADPVINQSIPAPVTAPAVPVDTDPLKTQQAQHAAPGQAPTAVNQHSADLTKHAPQLRHLATQTNTNEAPLNPGVTSGSVSIGNQTNNTVVNNHIQQKASPQTTNVNEQLAGSVASNSVNNQALPVQPSQASIKKALNMQPSSFHSQAPVATQIESSGANGNVPAITQQYPAAEGQQPGSAQSGQEQAVKQSGQSEPTSNSEGAGSTISNGGESKK